MAQRISAAICLFVVLLAGCLTQYQPSVPVFLSDSPGYSEKSLGDLVFEVEVFGKIWTSERRIRDIAMVCAAELSRSLGYAYFLVLSDSSTSESTVSLAGSGFAVYPSTSSRPVYFLIFECSNNTEDTDVLEILSTLGPDVGYSP